MLVRFNCSFLYGYGVKCSLFLVLYVFYLLKLWPQKEMVKKKKQYDDDDDGTLHWPENATTQLLTFMVEYLCHNPRGG